MALVLPEHSDGELKSARLWPWSGKGECDLCSSFCGAELLVRCNQRLSESGGKPGVVKINFTPRFTLTWICISLRGWEKFNMSIMQSAGRIEQFYGCWLNGEDGQRHAQSPITSQAWKQITPNWQNYTDRSWADASHVCFHNPSHFPLRDQKEASTFANVTGDCERFNGRGLAEVWRRKETVSGVVWRF